MGAGGDGSCTGCRQWRQEKVFPNGLDVGFEGERSQEEPEVLAYTTRRTELPSTELGKAGAERIPFVTFKMFIKHEVTMLSKKGYTSLEFG